MRSSVFYKTMIAVAVIVPGVGLAVRSAPAQIAGHFPSAGMMCGNEYSHEMSKNVSSAVKRSGGLCGAALPAAFATTEEALGGVWLTADGSTKVRIEACGAAKCGRIVWLREPTDPSTGRPWLDAQNEAAELRGRPLLGVSLITDLKSSGEGVWSGSLYNPLDGKTYRGALRKIDDSHIELKGCVLAVLCKDEIWTKGR